MNRFATILYWFLCALTFLYHEKKTRAKIFKPRVEKSSWSLISCYGWPFQNVADIPTVPAERVAFLFQRKATLELTQ